VNARIPGGGPDEDVPGGMTAQTPDCGNRQRQRGERALPHDSEG
jgi:hypothetical protein